MSNSTFCIFSDWCPWGMKRSGPKIFFSFSKPRCFFSSHRVEIRWKREKVKGAKRRDIFFRKLCFDGRRRRRRRRLSLSYSADIDIDRQPEWNSLECPTTMSSTEAKLEHGTSKKSKLRRIWPKGECVIVRLWWSSGKRPRLLLRRPEFESCWLLNLCEKTKINEK